ncbi:unnamed protein product [Caenorhabditis bovis]|uniref:Complex I assembly factor TIMMDC1, mitochondrial n=1 Tax=Caenorhabditis bovis TaxID=2654633 RepID=A0A8S1FDK8_9PELO|nr:unnamed protein product [Caenorhabditis bovis]
MPEEEKTSSGGWWSWIGLGGSSATHLTNDRPQDIQTIHKSATTEKSEPSTSAEIIRPGPVNQVKNSDETGWDRVKALYNKGTMETDIVERVVRMSFLGGFIVGGATGYAQAKHAYDVNNVGRKYLSPRDAVKRNIDYAIVRFAKGGFGVGFKCALISGSIVLLTTHLAAYRDRFSSWYFPAISALVGGVFTFPVGLLGSVKAVGLGVSSGLTLSAVVHLYAMSIDKPVAEAYRTFKRDYEKELKTALEWDLRVEQLMKDENITWRQTAVKRLKQLDQQKLAANDD